MMQVSRQQFNTILERYHERTQDNLTEEELVQYLNKQGYRLDFDEKDLFDGSIESQSENDTESDLLNEGLLFDVSTLEDLSVDEEEAEKLIIYSENCTGSEIEKLEFKDSNTNAVETQADSDNGRVSESIQAKDSENFISSQKRKNNEKDIQFEFELSDLGTDGEEDKKQLLVSDNSAVKKTDPIVGTGVGSGGIELSDPKLTEKTSLSSDKNTELFDHDYESDTSSLGSEFDLDLQAIEEEVDQSFSLTDTSTSETELSLHDSSNISDIEEVEIDHLPDATPKYADGDNPDIAHEDDVPHNENFVEGATEAAEVSNLLEATENSDVTSLDNHLEDDFSLIATTTSADEYEELFGNRVNRETKVQDKPLDLTNLPNQLTADSTNSHTISNDKESNDEEKDMVILGLGGLPTEQIVLENDNPIELSDKSILSEELKEPSPDNMPKMKLGSNSDNLQFDDELSVVLQQINSKSKDSKDCDSQVHELTFYDDKKDEIKDEEQRTDQESLSDQLLTKKNDIDSVSDNVRFESRNKQSLPSSAGMDTELKKLLHHITAMSEATPAHSVETMSDARNEEDVSKNRRKNRRRKRQLIERQKKTKQTKPAKSPDKKQNTDNDVADVFAALDKIQN